MTKETISDTRLGRGAGGDNREGRMKVRKALFCGLSEGDELNEGSAEDGVAAEGTTAGLRREAQGS